MAELREAAKAWPSPVFNQPPEFYALSPTHLLVSGKLGDQIISREIKNKSTAEFEKYVLDRLEDDLYFLEQEFGLSNGSLRGHFKLDMKMRVTMFTASTASGLHSVQSTFGEGQIPQSCNFFVARLNGLPRDSQDIMLENLGYISTSAVPLAIRPMLTLAEEAAFEFYHEATHLCQLMAMQNPAYEELRSMFIHNNQFREVMADIGAVLFVLREEVQRYPNKSLDEIVQKPMRIARAHMDYREISNTHQLMFVKGEVTPYAPSSPALGSLLDRLQDPDSALELLACLESASLLDVASLAIDITNQFFNQTGWQKEYNASIQRRARVLGNPGTADPTGEAAAFRQKLDHYIVQDPAEARDIVAKSIQDAWQYYPTAEERHYYLFQKCFTLAQGLNHSGHYDYGRKDSVNRFLNHIQKSANREGWPDGAKLYADGILSVANDRFKPTQRRDAGLKI